MSGYRISDPPPPEVFELAQKKPMRGLITLAGVLALAGIVALLTGGVFTVLVAFAVIASRSGRGWPAADGQTVGG